MSVPSVFPVITAAIDVPGCREIVLPHYVYSGILQVTFSLPLQFFLLLPVSMVPPGKERFDHQALTTPSTRCDIDAQIEELS